MKLTIVLFALFSLFTSKQEKIDIKYAKALHYIENSKEIRKHFRIKGVNKNCYKVSAQIISMNIYLPFFRAEIDEQEELKQVHRDNEQPIIAIDTVLSKLSCDSKADLLIYFSDINKNYLVAEMLKDIDAYSNDYVDLTQINVSKVILFEFDEDANIKNAYIKEFAYN